MSPEAVSNANGSTTPVAGRLADGRAALEQTREGFWAVCEPVNPPKLTPDYVNYFCARILTNVDTVKKNEPRRLKLYEAFNTYLQSYSVIQNELEQAGYSTREVASIEKEVRYFEDVVRDVKQAAGEATR